MVDTYLDWIARHPRLHTFLGAGRRAPAGGSRVVAGTKAAIAARATELFSSLFTLSGEDTDLAPSIAFGLVGFVDATVDRWLTGRRQTLTSTQLAEFLSRSIWAVLDSDYRALGVEVDPHRPIVELLHSR
ncbi:MAG: hypothetical protein M3443_03395 [Actinomycetota bacterium]|nr:hypothetical protein [Actinomycetota bacterium]